jgi:uncharacterized membrane protein
LKSLYAWLLPAVLSAAIAYVASARVSNVILALLFAVPVLGEQLDPVTVGFALAVIGVVFVSRRLPVGQPKVNRDSGDGKPRD